MATRKKYKIVLSEKYVRKSENGKEWFQFPVNISGQLVAIQTIIPLDPYTEPDIEQIRKEAYKDGYNAGFGKKIHTSYQEGLADAWEAARTLWNTPNRKEIFGHTTFNTVLTTLTAQKTIEKIRQYEQEREIQVGDEVNAPFGKAIVVNIDSVAEKIWLVYADGHGGFEYFKDAPTKTGRHFSEIAEVLRKMGETNNG